jgi:SAM-dependent methyltransferase
VVAAPVTHAPAHTTWRDHSAWVTAAESLRATEAALAPCTVADAEGATSGHCDACGDASRFVWHPGTPVRENLPCLRCGCIGRQRAVAGILLAGLPAPARARVYATEQASVFHLALRRRVARLRGSEFAPWRLRLRLSAWLWRRGVPAWIPRGDVTDLRFDTASLDGVVSQDVLEHVEDYRAALRGIARVLRPGAPFVFSVPWYEARAGNVQIASTAADGRVVHAGEPEFHGDPVGGGVLCFHHFGWALLEDLRSAGFADAVACRVQDPGHGLPSPLWVLRATR